MQDRFRFRAWIKKEQRYSWFLNLFNCGKGSNYEVEDYDEQGNHYTMYNPDEVILEQCTGLKDKNGKLIYEGDIVKIIDKSSRKEPFIGVVEYTKIASFEANCNGLYMYLHESKTDENISMVEKIFCTSLREIEVIGNIHENPELLE